MVRPSSATTSARWPRIREPVGYRLPSPSMTIAGCPAGAAGPGAEGPTGPGLEVVVAPRHEAPADGQQPGRDDELDDLARQERPQPVQQGVLDAERRGDAEPRHADGEDDHVADDHGGDRAHQL